MWYGDSVDILSKGNASVVNLRKYVRGRAAPEICDSSRLSSIARMPHGEELYVRIAGRSERYMSTGNRRILRCATKRNLVEAPCGVRLDIYLSFTLRRRQAGLL